MKSLVNNYAHAEHGMLLKLSSVNLLVPDIMVEEICWPASVQAVKNAPDWFLGFFNWENFRLPLISFEKMNGQNDRDFSAGTSVAIINGSVNHHHLPYYGLIVGEENRLVPLKKKSIAPDFGKPIIRAEACWTIVENESAVIPKVDWLEEHLLSFILHN